jgi:hypothetical protein
VGGNGISGDDCVVFNDGTTTLTMSSEMGAVSMRTVFKKSSNPEEGIPLTTYVLTGITSGEIEVVSPPEPEIQAIFRFGSSFDYTAVTSATALGAGYGNYGGVYRDGIVALGDENGMVSLVPWNSVVSALGLELGERVDPRNIYPEEDDPLAIEIDIVDPSAN